MYTKSTGTVLLKVFPFLCDSNILKLAHLLPENITNKNTKTSSLDKDYKDLSYGSFSLCHYVAAKVACDSLHQYLHRHSRCDLAILILGTLSHSASASCQHGTPGKIIKYFWKITRGSIRQDFICFHFLCIREFRCLQFASFLTFFHLGVSPFFCSLPLHRFSFSCVTPFHTLPPSVMSFACSNSFHKNGRATKNPLHF